MSDRCTLGANIDYALYAAFSAYCSRNGVTTSTMLRDFVMYCVASEMPEYNLPESAGGLAKNQKIIDYFKQKPKP